MGIDSAAGLGLVDETNDMICPYPNCHYEGRPKRQARGLLLVGLWLCGFFLLPGILYFLFNSGFRYFCPRCKMQISEDRWYG